MKRSSHGYGKLQFLVSGAIAKGRDLSSPVILPTERDILTLTMTNFTLIGMYRHHVNSSFLKPRQYRETKEKQFYGDSRDQ